MKRGSYKPPFPWFGGKSRVAPLVWRHLGDVKNYVEPFFGSGAVLFGRHESKHAVAIETVNDADGLLANFWRALKHDPDAVAEYADNPVNENDLHARHSWLVREALPTLAAKLEGDPDYHDSKIAGWWVWGICCWIGGGFCSGNGPWVVENGTLTKRDAGRGVNRKRVHLSNAGRGVNRALAHLGDAGRGVNRTRIKFRHSGCGTVASGDRLLEYMRRLADRLRAVRVCCGDWSRVCGPSPTHKNGITGVFLDPPYGASAKRRSNLYRCDTLSIAADVHKWCIANGDNPKLRIALCGYEGEHEMPDSWLCVPWRANGGYSNQGNGNGNANKHRERIWFSPHCLGVDSAKAKQLEMELA